MACRGLRGLANGGGKQTASSREKKPKQNIQTREKELTMRRGEWVKFVRQLGRDGKSDRFRIITSSTGVELESPQV